MKLFTDNKWEAWWNSLSPQMQQYLKSQPVWHDRDMYKAGILGFTIGLLVGMMF